MTNLGEGERLRLGGERRLGEGDRLGRLEKEGDRRPRPRGDGERRRRGDGDRRRLGDGERRRSPPRRPAGERDEPDDDELLDELLELELELENNH